MKSRARIEETVPDRERRGKSPHFKKMAGDIIDPLLAFDGSCGCRQATPESRRSHRIRHPPGYPARRRLGNDAAEKSRGLRAGAEMREKRRFIAKITRPDRVFIGSELLALCVPKTIFDLVRKSSIECPQNKVSWRRFVCRHKVSISPERGEVATPAQSRLLRQPRRSRSPFFGRRHAVSPAFPRARISEPLQSRLDESLPAR